MGSLNRETQLIGPQTDHTEGRQEPCALSCSFKALYGMVKSYGNRPVELWNAVNPLTCQFGYIMMDGYPSIPQQSKATSPSDNLYSFLYYSIIMIALD